MGSSSKTHDPNFSGNMNRWLQGAMTDLESWNPSAPSRAPSDSLVGSIGRAQGQIGTAQDWYSSQVGQTVSDEFQQNLVDMGSQAFGQAQAGINTAATGSGNMGSSRAGLAEGAAMGAISQQMNQAYMAEQARLDQLGMDAAGAATGLIGADTQFEQYLREIAQGDIRADWVGNTIDALPNVIKARIYSWLESGSTQGAVS